MDVSLEQEMSPGLEGCQPCLFLDKLPPELRVRIYEYLLVSSKRLVPKRPEKTRNSVVPTVLFRRSVAHQAKGPYAVDITTFLLSKQIYEEAADVFYSRNKFCIHFDYFCKCWNSEHPLRLNKQRIKHFKIQGVNLDHEDPLFWERCKNCGTDGFALLKYLDSLPNLRSVTIAFANVESFAFCTTTAATRLRKLAKAASLEASEVGRIHITGTKTLIELRIPSLLRNWPLAAQTASRSPYSQDYELELEAFFGGSIESRAEMCVYTALRDILHHAVAFGETTKELQSSMQKLISPEGVHIHRLNAKQKATLSIALAECMVDMIDTDGGNMEMADRSDLVEIELLESDGEVIAGTDG